MFVDFKLWQSSLGKDSSQKMPLNHALFVVKKEAWYIVKATTYSSTEIKTIFHWGTN